MTGQNTEDIGRDALGFEIVGATPEERRQLVLILHRLPRSHRKSFKELKIIMESEWNLFINRLNTAAGLASLGAPEPVLIRERCTNNLTYTALHEIGHTIWHNFLKRTRGKIFLMSLSGYAVASW
jgi:hypothetical protein